MNNKGVTLIELLAIIVIMGIIASIATISVSQIFTNTRKKAFVNVGDAMIESARLSYAKDESFWEDDKATLQELVDGGYIAIGEYDPWSGTYDYELSYVLCEYVNASANQDLLHLSADHSLIDLSTNTTVFKVKIVTSIAILGKDQALEDYSTDDIYFIEVGSGSIIDSISVMFDSDLSENTTLNDSDNFFTVQDDIKNGAKVNTLDGDDTVIVGGSVTDSAYLDTGAGNDTAKISQDVSDNATVSTGAGDDTVDVYNKLRAGGIVNTGDGADTVTIYINFEAASLDTGTGDDTLIVGNISSGANIDSGTGNDKLTVHAVSNSFSNATISLGLGDDRLNIYDTMTGTSSIWNGGEGDDTLFLPEVSISSWLDGISSNFTGFETIILLDETLYY